MCARAKTAGLVLGLCLPLLLARADAAGFTRLAPLPKPRIVAASPTTPFGNTPASAIIDGDPHSEFASAGQGLATFVEFDFGGPTRIAGFEHQDDWKNGTVARSELIFYDEQGREVGRAEVVHPDKRGGVAFKAITPAIVARKVRWHVTRLGAEGGRSVGGAEVAFFTLGASEAAPSGLGLDAVALPVTGAPGTKQTQPFQVSVSDPYAEPIDGVLHVGDLPPRPVHLQAGPQTFDFSLPVSALARDWELSVQSPAGAPWARRQVTVPAFRRLTIYVLPHSHVDIGYTQLQSEVEEKQVNNLLEGMAAARRTAHYPAGARFVWNLEGLWPADLYLRRLSAAQKAQFQTAVRDGQVALDGMYFNELTGLCRPEELLDLFRYGTALRAQTGANLDSAMISDVPGYTWGTVTALAQAGIRYFSVGPNHFDRIGTTMLAWENKPFWWVGPSGRDRVLVWVPSSGYGLSHIIRHLSPRWLLSYADELTREGYPYDVAYIRWSGLGDNAVPDPSICDFVRDWNAAHAWPHFVIGSVHDAFSDLERRHGGQLPVMRGDWTPYWDDGAGSSARETAMNAASADRLSQAEAVWAALEPRTFPAREFAEAMRSVLLYDEHTWGASMSVTAPANPQVEAQWSIKRGDAACADVASRELLSRAEALAARAAPVDASVDVFNSVSWARGGLVVVPMDLAMPGAGDRVIDEGGRPVPSQRLATGELAFFAPEIPPFASRRFAIESGSGWAPAAASAHGARLDNGRLQVTLDVGTGAIAHLRTAGSSEDLVDDSAGQALNEYLYFNGADASAARTNGPVTLRLKEKGPLVVSLAGESSAPGCFSLTREVELVAGEDVLRLTDVIDKQRVNGKSFENYRAPEAKESVNLAFPFRIPGGQVRLSIPMGVIRPDADQIPGACKNWFVVDRWADVSNDQRGVTLAPLDSPLLEVGGLTANLLNSQTNPAVWRTQVGPTQKLYAWVMNNHWGTNYRAYQEGPVTFRFLIRPHGAYDPSAASRLAVGAAQPLLVLRAHGQRPPGIPRIELDSPEVSVLALKPSDDGRAVIVRLWGAGGRDARVHVRWSDPRPRSVRFSDTSEAGLGPAPDAIDVPGWGVVTLRAEL